MEGNSEQSDQGSGMETPEPKAEVITDEMIRESGALPLSDYLLGKDRGGTPRSIEEMDAKIKAADDAWTSSALLDSVVGKDAPKGIKVRVVDVARLHQPTVKGFEELQIQGGIQQLKGLLPNVEEDKLLKLWSVPVARLCRNR